MAVFLCFITGPLSETEERKGRTFAKRQSWGLVSVSCSPLPISLLYLTFFGLCHNCLALGVLVFAVAIKTRGTWQLHGYIPRSLLKGALSQSIVGITPPASPTSAAWGVRPTGETGMLLAQGKRKQDIPSAKICKNQMTRASGDPCQTQERRADLQNLGERGSILEN